MNKSQAKTLGRPPGGGGQAKVPSAAELTRIGKCLTGTHTEARDHALLYLQYATGMRAGELAALDVGDVLHQGKLRREFRLGTDDTKYCRARTIYLESPKAIKALLTYLHQRNPRWALPGRNRCSWGRSAMGTRGAFACRPIPS